MKPRRDNALREQGEVGTNQNDLHTRNCNNIAATPLLNLTCPKYEKCSAPICPLDPNWRNAKHLNGERFCFYLGEAQKGGAEALFVGRGLGELYQVMAEVTPDVSARWGTIRNALARAATAGSRMNTKPPRGGAHG